MTKLCASWPFGPPWMRSSSGYFCPATASGGRVIRPWTSVPSLALGGDVMRRAQLQLRHQGVVMAGELAQLAIFKGNDIGGRGIGGPDQYMMAAGVITGVRRRRDRRSAAWSCRQQHLPTGDIPTGRLHQNGDGLAVRREAEASRRRGRALRSEPGGRFRQRRRWPARLRLYSSYFGSLPWV